MTGQIVIRYDSHIQRRQPLLANQQSKKKQKLHLAEVAGGTTAECAAVCCCCPCGLVNLLYVTVYKLPTGLCMKALKKKKAKSFKKGLLPQKRRCDETDNQVYPVSIDLMPSNEADMDNWTASKEVVELENEMWDRFHNTGFWRSPSQRDIPSVCQSTV